VRGTKVGHVVLVRPPLGAPVPGTIVAVDKQQLRCVATAQGHVWSVPDEMFACDEPDRTKAVEDIDLGDRVVLWQGAVRVVCGGARSGETYTLAFEPAPGLIGAFRYHQMQRGERLYVMPPVGDAE
jgi:hypothetical protein